jgi:hypothetical protein
MTSYLSSAPFFVKLGLNMLIGRFDMQPVVKISVYNYLWNNTNPILKFANTMAPSMVPIDNVGVFHMVSEAWSRDSEQLIRCMCHVCSTCKLRNKSCQRTSKNTVDFALLDGLLRRLKYSVSHRSNSRIFNRLYVTAERTNRFVVKFTSISNVQILGLMGTIN